MSIKKRLLKLIGRLISRLYWRFGYQYDDNKFWSKVMIFAAPAGMSGRRVVAMYNERLQCLELKAEDEEITIRQRQKMLVN